MKKTKLIIVSLVTIISVVLMMMAGFTACPQTATTEETTTTTLGFYFEITSIWTTDDANWNNYSTGWDNDLLTTRRVCHYLNHFFSRDGHPNGRQN